MLEPIVTGMQEEASSFSAAVDNVHLPSNSAYRVAAPLLGQKLRCPFLIGIIAYPYALYKHSSLQHKSSNRLHSFSQFVVTGLRRGEADS